MKNPVEKAIVAAVVTYSAYLAAVLCVLAIWTVGVLIGWNGFMTYAFHLPELDFWRALAAVALLNFGIAPLYALATVDKK